MSSGSGGQAARTLVWFLASFADSGVPILLLEAESEYEATCRLLVLLRELHSDCWGLVELSVARGDAKGLAAYEDTSFAGGIQDM